MISYSHTPRLPSTVQSSSQLRPLTAPQPDSLPVLLKLGDKLITLLNNIVVLLILVIRSVGLDDSLSGHAVDGAGNTPGRDELSQVTEVRLVISWVIDCYYIPVQEVHRDAKIISHVFKTDNAVALQ
jgi:hypothetical protein